MNKPVIGIVAARRPDPNSPAERDVYYVGEPYCRSVIEAGGLPVLIPPGSPFADAASLLDGLLIMGGDDIDPSKYGQATHEKSVLETDDRFQTEAALMAALDPAVPVLGICYGCQFINVLRRGTLHQHVPDQVGHELHSGGTEEVIQVDERSRLGDILGQSSVRGKSYHHQAIDQLGEGLVATARAADGTIEAIELPGDRWLVGVQWHPERSADDPVNRRLFTEFVDAAARAKSQRESCGTW